MSLAVRHSKSFITLELFVREHSIYSSTMLFLILSMIVIYIFLILLGVISFHYLKVLLRMKISLNLHYYLLLNVIYSVHIEFWLAFFLHLIKSNSFFAVVVSCINLNTYCKDIVILHAKRKHIVFCVTWKQTSINLIHAKPETTRILPKTTLLLPSKHIFFFWKCKSSSHSPYKDR